MSETIWKTLRRCPVLLVVACLLPFAVSAESGWQDRFCIEAQQVLAGTELVPALQVHEQFEPFVESKAMDSPFTVQQFLSNPDPDRGMPRTLSCKMRTAERINATQQVSSGTPAARKDRDCVAVHRRMLDKVLAGLPPDDRGVLAARIVFDEDDTTYMGPNWIKPWPYDAVKLSADGTLHLRARALYAPHAWWIPMPARFKGNYYCHLVAPDYLEALLRDSTGPGS